MFSQLNLLTLVFVVLTASWAQAAESVRVKDTQAQKLVDQYLLKISKESKFEKKNTLLKQLQKKISDRVDELVPTNESEQKETAEPAQESTATEDVVSLNASLSLIQLRKKSDCQLDTVRIKNAEPPAENKNESDYKTKDATALTLKILSTVCQ
jgi:hypothetical protein